MNGLGTQQSTKIKLPSQECLAKEFRSSTRTIRRWLNSRPILKLGRKPRMNKSQLETFLYQYIPTNPTATQKEMAEYVSQQIGKPISQQAISWTLKTHGITRKKATYLYSEQLRWENQKKIKNLINEVIPSLPQNRILAVDESGFTLNLAPRYGYSFQGRRAKARKPGIRGDNHTLILLVQNTAERGVIHHKVIKKGMKTQHFYDFLKEVKLPTDEEYYLLLDNLSVHRSDKIKELLKQKNIIPIYLPSYSPNLNPVEEMFNTVKGYVKRDKPRTDEQVNYSIDQAVEKLQSQNLTKYFDDCLKKEEEWWKKSSKVRRKVPSIVSRIGKIEDPHKWFYNSLIYPSWRWMKLGARPTLKKMRSAVERVKNHFEESLKLSI